MEKIRQLRKQAKAEVKAKAKAEAEKAAEERKVAKAVKSSNSILQFIDDLLKLRPPQ